MVKGKLSGNLDPGESANHVRQSRNIAPCQGRSSELSSNSVPCSTTTKEENTLNLISGIQSLFQLA